MTKKQNRLGRILVALGAACFLAYVLTALRGVSPAAVRVGGVLFYAGIALLLAGLALRWWNKEKAGGDTG